MTETPSSKAQRATALMKQLIADLFFMVFSPVALYWYWYLLGPSCRYGVVPLGGDSAVFFGPTELWLFATGMMVGCVSWSLVYAAQLLLRGRTQILWQVALLLLPPVAPVAFYLFILRRRHPSVASLPLPTKTLAVILSAGLAAGVRVVLSACYPQGLGMWLIAGLFVVGLFWGFVFWAGPGRGIDEFFSAIRAAAVAGAVYGITIQNGLLSFPVQHGGTIWTEVLIMVYSALWGTTGGAFVTCCSVVVPGLLGAELKGLRGGGGRRRTAEKHVTGLGPPA